MRLNYELQVGLEKFRVQQKGSIALNQDYAFYIPNSVNLDSAGGVYLTIDAVLGVRVFSLRIASNPDCFHLWGTTLIPQWSRMNCW